MDSLGIKTIKTFPASFVFDILISMKTPDRQGSKKEDKADLEVVSISFLKEKIRKLHEKPSAAIGLLLSGDRISCCDEGVVMQEGENVIGVATIAPEGEEQSGQPTIVALYVSKEYRGKGYGSQIL